MWATVQFRADGFAFDLIEWSFTITSAKVHGAAATLRHNER
jgi:hypothetical protein